MTSEVVRWSLLMLFIGLMSAAVVIVAGVSLWVAGAILVAWLIVFVWLWPTKDET